MLIAIGEASEKAFKEGYEMFKQPMALAENTLTCAGKVKSVEDLVKQFGKPKRKG